MVKRSWKRQLEMMWHGYIGNRQMTEKQEIEKLIEVRMNEKLPWREVYRLYMSSKFWKRIKRERLIKDNFQCVLCSSREALQLDHLQYTMMGSETLDDVRILCKQCHAKHTTYFDIIGGGHAYDEGKIPKRVGEDDRSS